MNTKRYVVRVEQTFWLWANVAVDATNQDDAQNMALQQFDLLPTKCRCQECDTRVVSEDGERVEWCERAFVRDWKNPYRKVASPARDVKPKEPTTDEEAP